MLTTTTLPRIFIFSTSDKEIRLADPSDKLSVEAVRNFYANTYPILTTAIISGPEIKDDEVVYTFSAELGTKG